ncbi:hypothetical protein AVEN_33883-1 [Araneus ventricosus]|uniref:Uncharacterized protein n=1 Tax=Araneus ventricosus TaxID=182803 RepID=A0A4Y2EI13_ARAVE|nr:hypothetical protein AVEN_33883-1 [Araneus ventricosus]
MGLEQKYQALISDTEEGKTDSYTLKVNHEVTNNRIRENRAKIEDENSVQSVTDSVTLGVTPKIDVSRKKIHRIDLPEQRIQVGTDWLKVRGSNIQVRRQQPPERD